MRRQHHVLVMRFLNDSYSSIHKLSGKRFSILFIFYKIINILYCSEPLNITTLKYKGCMLVSCLNITILACRNFSASVSAWGRLCCLLIFLILCFSLGSCCAHLKHLPTAPHIHIMTLITQLVTGALRDSTSWGEVQFTCHSANTRESMVADHFENTEIWENLPTDIYV